MTPGEPARHRAGDTFAMLPAAAAALSLFAAVSGGGVSIIYADALGEAALWLGLVAFLGWLFSFAIGFFAAGVAVGQIVGMRGQDRSVALPATAGLIAVLVLFSAVAPVVASVVTAIGAYAAASLAVAPQPAPNPHAYAVPLTAPWTTMKLPVGNGAVVYSDATTVSISYSGAKLSSLATSYAAAASLAGWTLTSTATNPSNGAVTSTFAGAGKSLTLSVMDTVGTQTVSLTTY